MEGPDDSMKYKSDVPNRDPFTSSVVINPATPETSPRSGRCLNRLAPSPLTPEAMRRISLLTVQEEIMDHHVIHDPSKLSPISPSLSITTSDLGSSPRSSISIHTVPHSFAWSTYREQKKSSSDFTDVDSDMCKDLFSPTITLSPAPFSPFSDQPPITTTCSALASPREYQRFSFDTRPPLYLPQSRSSHFLVPPPVEYGLNNKRERSRSDSDTIVTTTSVAQAISAGPELAGKSSGENESASAKESHKHLYKKRLLRKYKHEKGNVGYGEFGRRATSVNEDTGPLEIAPAPKSCRPTLEPFHGISIALPMVQQPLPLPSPVRCTSSLSDYGNLVGSSFWAEPTFGTPSIQQTQSRVAPFESLRLPLMKFEDDKPSMDQARFDYWLKTQVTAIDPLWNASGAHHSTSALDTTRPHAFQSTPGPLSQPPHLALLPPSLSHQLHRPSPIYPTPMSHVAMRYQQLHTPTLSSSETFLMGRRSRSEPDVFYECQQCGQSFNMRDRLVKHLASRHKDTRMSANSNEKSVTTKSHKCTVCQKYFGRSDMLTRHMRLHTGIRPYICQTCGQVFSRSDHLATHQRTHTGEKPYQCPLCKYSASRRDMITRHMRTHTRSGTFDVKPIVKFGQMPTLEAAVDKPVSAEPSTSYHVEPECDPWYSSASKISPASNSSDRGSDSSGSVCTIRCLEEEGNDGATKGAGP